MKLPTLQQLKPIASGFVFGVAIGVWVGLYGVQARYMYSSMINAFGTSFTLSTRAHTRYCNADYDGAREAQKLGFARLSTIQNIARAWNRNAARAQCLQPKAQSPKSSAYQT